MQRLNRRQVVIGAAVVAALAFTVGITAVARGSSSDDARPTATDAATTEPAPSGTRAATPTTRVATTSTSTTASVSTTTSTSSTTSTTISWTTTTSSTTTTTIDPALLLPSLREGDSGLEVITLQRMLNNVTGSSLVADGVFGPATTEAVRNLQRFVGLEASGVADHATRTLLAEADEGRSAALPSWPVPSIGNGGADGCQVAVVGDSLMAYSAPLHDAAIREINCAPGVDGVGGRSLAWGWQCRVAQPGGGAPLLLLPEAEPGNETCAPSGLELLELWAGANAFGDLVVIALGTNDAVLFDEARWVRSWNEAVRLTGGRPLIFLTVKARPGSSQTADLDRYSAVLRRWCDDEPRCHLADWALTPRATDGASYVDSVHLTRAATGARAAFIRDAVLALFEGRPLPNPRPLPVVTPTIPTIPTPLAPTTTISRTTTTAATTTTTRPVPTTSTIAATATTTTNAPSATSTTSTTSSTSTTSVPSTSTSSTLP